MLRRRSPAGVYGVPTPISTADATNDTTSSASNQVGPIAATATAPSANPVSTVT